MTFEAAGSAHREGSRQVTSGMLCMQAAWHHSPDSVVGLSAPPTTGHRQQAGSGEPASRSSQARHIHMSSIPAAPIKATMMLFSVTRRAGTYPSSLSDKLAGAAQPHVVDNCKWFLKLLVIRLLINHDGGVFDDIHKSTVTAMAQLSWLI